MHADFVAAFQQPSVELNAVLRTPHRFELRTPTSSQGSPVLKIILNPVGTAGDIHPFVDLALELRNLGREVIFVTNPTYRPLIESYGFPLVAVGETLDLEKLTHNKSIHRHSSAWRLSIKWCTTSAMEETYRTIVQIAETAPSIVVAPLVSFGARIARETHDLTLVNLVTSPVLLSSQFRSPRRPMMLLDDWVPFAAKQFQYWFADRFVIDPLLCPAVNRFRRTLGLMPQQRLLNRWWYSPDFNFGMFDRMFAAQQKDWPSNFAHTGFPCWDPPSTQDDLDYVQQFLSDGSPPVAIVPGSVGPGNSRYYEIAIDACRQNQRRCLILNPHSEFLPFDVPNREVGYSTYVELARVLPYCHSIIHSCGIGTVAQALAAGIPQIAIPRVNDQFDTAYRLRELGVAAICSGKRMRVSEMAKLLRNCCDSDWQQKCRSIGRHFSNEVGIHNLATRIDQIAPVENYGLEISP